MGVGRHGELQEEFLIRLPLVVVNDLQVDLVLLLAGLEGDDLIDLLVVRRVRRSIDRLNSHLGGGLKVSVTEHENFQLADTLLDRGRGWERN